MTDAERRKGRSRLMYDKEKRTIVRVNVEQEQKMIDERQKQLCDALHTAHPSRIMCREAANEIERLIIRCNALERELDEARKE